MAGIVLLLMGCAGEETSSDGTSPNHIIKAPKSQGKYLFGITDTISVEFSENIDTGALDLDFSVTGISYRIRDLRNLIVFGTVQSHGTTRFPINMPFIMTMTGLRDPDGNGHPSIEESFFPLPWVDRDVIDTTYDFYDTLYSGSNWIDGTPGTDSLVMEGGLDDNQNFGRIDRLDFKVIRVAGADTVSVVLTTVRELNLKIQIAGPFNPAGFDTLLPKYVFDMADPVPTPEGTKRLFRDSTGSRGMVSYKFVANLFDHRRVLNDFDAAGLYVVRLRVPEEKEGFYRLGFRIRKFQ